VGDKADPQDVVRQLVGLQYRRNNGEITRGDIRLRGEVLDVWMPSRDDPLRIRFGWEGIERIQVCEAVSWEPLDDFEEAWIHPREFYMTGEERFNQALEDIEAELNDRLEWFNSNDMELEAHRQEKRTRFDLEMLDEVGSCKGVENYSMHFDGRKRGERSYCLLDFFSMCAEKYHGGSERYLVVMDESHVTLPQVTGMHGGDFSRKKNLIDHGFRLPSAYDNRPLRIDEFQDLVPQMMYVSATPGERELRHLAEITGQGVPEGLLHVQGGGGARAAERDKPRERVMMEGLLSQIEGVTKMEIRPTGLLDPNIEVRDTAGQVQDLEDEIRKRIEVNERVLVTVMTIKFAEEVANYLNRQGFKAHHLHSEIDTLERTEIIKALRLGHIDIIVGINLLREGLDIPEVSLVAIFDADKEGFLRNERSLLQTIGRASRNEHGSVILYADSVSPSMEAAISQTLARRGMQSAYNVEHGIVPQTIRKALPVMGGDVEDLLSGVAGKGKRGGRRMVGKARGKRGLEGFAQKFGLGAGVWNSSDSVLENVSQPNWVAAAYDVVVNDDGGDNAKLIVRLEKEMRQAAARLDFERAAQLRDRIFQLESASD
jgi:excinuclease ABC subunit B